MKKVTWTLAAMTVCSALLLGIDYTPITLTLLAITGIKMQLDHLTYARKG